MARRPIWQCSISVQFPSAHRFSRHTVPAYSADVLVRGSAANFAMFYFRRISASALFYCTQCLYSTRQVSVHESAVNLAMFYFRPISASAPCLTAPYVLVRGSAANFATFYFRPISASAPCLTAPYVLVRGSAANFATFYFRRISASELFYCTQCLDSTRQVSVHASAVNFGMLYFRECFVLTSVFRACDTKVSTPASPNAALNVGSTRMGGSAAGS